ncbi:MATE family efflux transporter [Fuchsiella alkaliacetigena]|nr:MATE family efflux transporter [Fuchsiella alkaliacetigena]
MTKKEEILRGSIFKTLVKLSAPIIIGMLMHTTFNIVDTYFISQLGTDSLAAISFTFPIFMFIIAIGNGIAVGGSSLISRLLGAGQEEKAINTIIHIILLTLLISLLFSIVGRIFAHQIFSFIGATGSIKALSLEYMQIIFSGSIFIFIFIAFDGILRGQGNMTTAMFNLSIATVINIVLDPLLIFGWGVFPALEMQGAALATIIAQAIASSCILIYFLKSNNVLPIKISSFKLNLNIITEIIKIGFPAFISQAIFSVALGFFNKLASIFGPAVVAAFGLGFRLDSIAVLPGIGLAAAMITMIGYNYGAQQLGRVKEITILGLKLIFTVMSLIGLVFFIIPEFFIKFFDSNPEVIKYGVQYFRYVSLSYGFLGLGFVSIAALQGIGYGAPAFFNNLIRFGIIGLPLSWLLVTLFNTSPVGIWVGMVASNLAYGIISTIWFFAKIRYEKSLKVTQQYSAGDSY